MGLGALLAAGCTATDLRARAALLDARGGTAAYTWIFDHAPSALDVAGFSVEAVQPLDPDGRVRTAPSEPHAACRQALQHRALLLIYAPASQPALRSAALDCGFALERDATAVVVAPR